MLEEQHGWRKSFGKLWKTRNFALCNMQLLRICLSTSFFKTKNLRLLMDWHSIEALPSKHVMVV